MLFNSLGFVVFFSIFFLIYWLLLSRRLSFQNVWLLIGSLFFYACWDWHFLSLIGVTIISTYLTAIYSEKIRLRRVLTILNIIINLTILGVFKYFNFFSENFAKMMLWWGVEVDWVTLDVLLPVGISFYTFQAIGYSVDVYRRKIAAERDLVAFSVFICYFPQLVAGPIESAGKLLPQIKKTRQWHSEMAVRGMRQALWGLFKKVVIADACAPHVTKAFEAAGSDQISQFTALLAALLFAVQIYCDFSGYCDIARGVSRCLGIDLTQNFRYPYFSSNVREFWQRWNISLMTWFKEYVYIPLGGSRHGQFRTYVNLFVVFLLSGLWHGASWCFVAWGVYWGVIMVIYRLIDAHTKIHLPKSYGILLTCFLAVIGWVIFRSNTLEQAVHVVSQVALSIGMLAVGGTFVIAFYRIIARHVMCAGNIALWTCGAVFLILVSLRPVEVVHAYLLVYIFIMFVVEWHRRCLDCPICSLRAPAWLRIGIYWLLLILVLTNYMEEVPFIYFQF